MPRAGQAMSTVRTAASVAAFLTLAGCASPVARAPDQFEAHKYEPACARECLGGYSTCIGGASNTGGNRLIAVDANILEWPGPPHGSSREDGHRVTGTQRRFRRKNSL